jgi:probable HAF family extracellular repeat protein
MQSLWCFHAEHAPERHGASAICIEADYRFHRFCMTGSRCCILRGDFSHYPCPAEPCNCPIVTEVCLPRRANPVGSVFPAQHWSLNTDVTTMKNYLCGVACISCGLILTLGASPDAFSQRIPINLHPVLQPPVVQYTLTERATPSGYTQPTATGINSSGQAAGSAFAAGVEQPLFWQQAQPQKLPLPAGYVSGGCTAINKPGQPVGIAFDSNDDEHAVKWNLSLTGPTELNIPSGAEFPQPQAINEAGEVVGQFTDANDNQQAVSWNGTVPTLLTVNPAAFNAPPILNSVAYGINVSGVIAGVVFGQTSNGAGFSNAVSWNGASLTILGNLGGASSVNAGSEAKALNDAGWIVGDSVVPGSTISHAVLWKGTTVATDLGALLGASGNSYATGINNSGQIIGRSDSADQLGHAVLWQESAIPLRRMVMVDLNDATRLSRPVNIVLTSANAIADGGALDVTAINTTATANRATDYLLTPHFVTTTTLVSATNPAVYNESIKLEASVHVGLGVIATGEATFKDGPLVLGSVPLDLSGEASLTTTLPAAIHVLTAEYGGSTKNLPSTSAGLREQVTRAHSTTILTSSVNPASFGQTVSLTAEIHPVDGGRVTGSVIFRDGAHIVFPPRSSVIGTVAVSANGQAVLATRTLLPGIHNITAIYRGDRNVLPSTSPVLAETVR